MSKAFTRESDDAPEPAPPRRPTPVLPPGARNYITPEGARRLREELEHLVQFERPAAVAGHDPAQARALVQALDQRIQQIHGSLAGAVVVQPPSERDGRVRFGATVTVREEDGQQVTYRIVGVDETDLDKGWISWLSPLATALLKAREGDTIALKLPGGTRNLRILSVMER